jgi:Dynamin family
MPTPHDNAHDNAHPLASPSDAMLKPLALAALWRHRASKALGRWQQWLEAHVADTADDKSMADVTLLLKRSIDQLSKIKYTIAIVGEVSRGKSELINALLFAHTGQRVVPSGAGRTTMCPTEFFCDEDQTGFIELLPIETRAKPHSLQAWFDAPKAWERFAIDAQRPDSMAKMLQKVSDTQWVSIADAQLLGLYDESASHADGVVEIPVWRHARVNLHHPLLATGLCLLDTPGFNALGQEPELTYNVLPTVDAALFLVAADVGLSQSDLAAWQRYVGHLAGSRKLLLINKTDALADPLRSPLETMAALAQQIERSAKALGIAKDQVFALSGRQALLAKIAGDAAALGHSRITQLELSLTQLLLGDRQAALMQHTQNTLTYSYRIASQGLSDRVLLLETQYEELNALGGSQNRAQALDQYAAQTKQRYELETELAQTIRQTLREQHSNLLLLLSEPSVQAAFEPAILSCEQDKAPVIQQHLSHAIDQVRQRISRVMAELDTTHQAARLALKKIDKLKRQGLKPDADQSPSPSNADNTLDAVAGEQKTLTMSQMPMPIGAALGDVGAELQRMEQASATLLASSGSLMAVSNLMNLGAQHTNRVRLISAQRQRCVSLVEDTLRLCQRHVIELTGPIEQALKSHQALLRKRADTLERMQQARMAMAEHLLSLHHSIDAHAVQLAHMDEQYQLTLTAVSNHAGNSATGAESHSSPAPSALAALAALARSDDNSPTAGTPAAAVLANGFTLTPI